MQNFYESPKTITKTSQRVLNGAARIVTTSKIYDRGLIPSTFSGLMSQSE